jgi:hypothetical protein
MAASAHGMRVDFVPGSDHGLPGRLGIAEAPGRWRPGREGADDLVGMDVGLLRKGHGADVVVTLMEEQEMEQLGLGGLRGVLRRAGVASYWFPVAARSAPTSLASTARLVTRILRSLRRAETVVLHCAGGLGRSGTVAACCLVGAGKAPAAAIESVRTVRPGAIDVPDQVRFVEAYGTLVGRSRD